MCTLQPASVGSNPSRIPVLDRAALASSPSPPPVSPIPPHRSPSPLETASPVPPPVSDSPLPPLEEEDASAAGAFGEEQESVYSSAEDLLDPIMRSRRPNAKFTNTPVKVINPQT